jgi:hypothetical protein
MYSCVLSQRSSYSEHGHDIAPQSPTRFPRRIRFCTLIIRYRAECPQPCYPLSIPHLDASSFVCFFSRMPCMVCFLTYLFRHQQGDKVQICFVQVLGNGSGTCRILSRMLLQSFDLMVYPAEHSVTFLGCSAGYSAKMSLSTVVRLESICLRPRTSTPQETHSPPFSRTSR